MTNDNDVPRIHAAFDQSADSYGRAALLLVESLIHGLCEIGTLSPDAAAEITERAANVQSEQVDEAMDGEKKAAMQQSHGLLMAIASSLRIDGGQLTPPRLIS